MPHAAVTVRSGLPLLLPAVHWMLQVYHDGRPVPPYNWSLVKQAFLILAALSVLACDDPAIQVPLEFEIARGPNSSFPDTVISVRFVGADVAIDGMIWNFCEDFSAVASQWTDESRSVVTLYVQSEPATGVCLSQSRIYPYTALIQVQHPVTTGPTAWEVRVYHRGKRIPVPAW